MRPSPRSSPSALAAVLVVLVLGASAGARAQTPPPAPTPQTTADPEAEIAAARTALVARLVALAQWCHKSELFEESDKLWAQILVLDPKNIDAHKGLGHSRSGDGTWHETNRH